MKNLAILILIAGISAFAFLSAAESIAITGQASDEVARKIAECNAEVAKLTAERDREISNLAADRDREISNLMADRDREVEKLQSAGKQSEASAKQAEWDSQISSKRSEWNSKISSKQTEWDSKISSKRSECGMEIEKSQSEADSKAAESGAKLTDELAKKGAEADKKATEASANLEKKQSECAAEIDKFEREGKTIDLAKKIVECRTEISKLKTEAAKKQAELEREQAQLLLKSHAEEGRKKQVSLEIIGDKEIDRKIKFMSINARSDLLVEDLDDGKARVKLSDNTSQEINVLPNTAFRIALEKLRSENLNVRLEEIDQGGLAAVYTVGADKTVRLFGLFDVQQKLEVKINAKSGEIDFDKPWWWFLVEEQDEVKDLEMQLIKPIQDVVIPKDGERILLLNEYFLNAESYSVSEPKGVEIKIDKHVMIITPQRGWTGTAVAEIKAHGKDADLDALFNIIVTEEDLSIQTVQFGAILGEPVRWAKMVKVTGPENITLKLPKSAENIVVRSEIDESRINVSLRETQEDVELEVSEDDDYEVQYYTDPPSLVEHELSATRKKLTVFGSDEVHYTDVLAFKHLQKEAAGDLIRMYWLTESGRKEVELQKYDLNENGLVDYIEWTVPTLSNQTYELEFSIFNIQSYPTVNGNWTVVFNATGQADLTILAINGTSYGNSAPDDLLPLALRCDEVARDFTWTGNITVYQNWNCSGLGYWTVKVLTPGIHIQEFNFGGLIAHAFNFASDNISFVPPTPANNTAQNMNWIYVNITSQENLNNSILEWGSSSGYTNFTMSNISGVEWFRNMTALSDGDYNFTVWAHNGTNVTGIWVQSVRRFVSIDTVNPQISFGEGTASEYANISQNWIYVNISFTENNFVNVTFTLFNASGLVNSTVYSAATYMINWTGLADGPYTYQVNITDRAGNTNSTDLRHITLDTAAPFVSFSCPQSSYLLGEKAVCTCTVSDNTDPSPSVSFSNPVTTNIGPSYLTTCSATDRAGNSASRSVEYSVHTPDSGYPNYAISAADLTKGYNKVLLRNWKVNFKISGETHTILIKNMTNSSVSIVISSTPREASFAVGEEKKFELSGDNYYDLYVRLNSVENFRANMTITFIYEEIPSMQPPEAAKPSDQPLHETVVAAQDNGLTWTLNDVFIAAIIAIFILIAYKNPQWRQKPSRKRRTHHK